MLRVDVRIRLPVKSLYVSLGCASRNPITSKIQESLSQEKDPQVATSIGIYSIEGPKVGFMRGRVALHVYVLYVFAHLCSYETYELKSCAQSLRALLCAAASSAAVTMLAFSAKAPGRLKEAGSSLEQL